MDILIPDFWLKDFLKTSAKPEKIALCLSLCGPSVERITKTGKDPLYHIEVTTNRVDSVGVYSIAREAAAILPRFEISAKLLPLKTNAKQKLVKSVPWLTVNIDYNLCPRFTTILIKDVKLNSSPKLLQERLTAVGVRPINNVVDISNYLMHELGQPVHTFDYDKIADAKMTLRASKKGEKVTTLDGKTYTLPGNDIVIEDGGKRLIDLCGIMGGKNSAVDEKTRNVLLFVQTYNHKNIRKTSMSLAARTEAAALFEKSLDPELVEPTIRRGIDLFIEICKAKPEREILDLYPNPFPAKTVPLDLNFINRRMGILLNKKGVSQILDSLGFITKWSEENLEVTIPSWRANDVSIPEDIVEEVSRIYGYHNLPSCLMPGITPDPLQNSPFAFEKKIKETLKGRGGIEVYTYSMVAKEKVDLTGSASWATKLKNPLGIDSEYMRLSLAPSLVDAVNQNKGEKSLFYLFELANVYLPVRGDLPEEKMMAAGIFVNYQFAEVKGILETLFLELKSAVTFKAEDAKGFLPHHRLAIRAGKELGQLGVLQNSGYLYWEFDIEEIRKVSSAIHTFCPIPKYPAQVEDLALVIPQRIHLGNVVDTLANMDRQIVSVELIDSYENTRTFRVAYQSKEKTLTDKEVEAIRKKALTLLARKFAIKLKNQ